MSDQLAQFADISPSVSQRILEVLQHHQAEAGPLEMVADGAMRRGTRLYVPVRPEEQPPTMFSFMHAVASAELELRDGGLDIQLTPEFRQRYVVVATVAGDLTPYIYLSEEGAEYDDLERLLAKESGWGRDAVMIEGYPFDGPEDQESAWQEALAEHAAAKVLR
jgi:hypothetical protein